jgi:hypothetical protein
LILARTIDLTLTYYLIGVHKGQYKDGRTTLDGDVLDERKVKTKMMQAEQARALEGQMR